MKTTYVEINKETEKAIFVNTESMVLTDRFTKTSSQTKGWIPKSVILKRESQPALYGEKQPDIATIPAWAFYKFLTYTLD
jgi:hypothetical protein